MRKGSALLDVPRFVAFHTPGWLMRTNLVVWILTTLPSLFGVHWPLLAFGALIAFNFAWGFLAWRGAGSPAIDEQPAMDFRLSTLKSLWSRRNDK